MSGVHPLARRARLTAAVLMIGSVAMMATVISGWYDGVAAATSVTVSGRVTDTNGNPVVGVHVGIYATEASFVSTAANGTYSLTSVPVSSTAYDVQVLAPCHKDQSKSVLVTGSTTVNFTLAAAADKDSFGYTCGIGSDPHLAPTNNTGLMGDDVSATVLLPFGFKFYGTTYSSISIGSNGLASFTGNAANYYQNGPLPDTELPNGSIYPFWDDLDMSTAASSAILTGTFGSAPNRQFVIQWRNMITRDDHSNPFPSTFSFSAILSENGNITFTYDLLSTADLRSRGSSATIGIENGSGNVYLQRSFNRPFADIGLPIRFTAPK